MAEVLVLAPGDEASAAADEESRDWLTLSRMLGWRARIASQSAPPGNEAARLICIAGTPETLSETWTAALRRRVRETSVLVLAGVAEAGTDWGDLACAAAEPRGAEGFSGSRLAWHGPGPAVSWVLPEPLSARQLLLGRDTEVWATLDGRPVLAARRSEGSGVVVSTGLHPTRARAQAGAATALFTRILTLAAPGPSAWLDLEGAVVLRMDDPGASANVHLRSWAYPKLGEQAWRTLGAGLALRGARMTVAYTPGWVDDGDAERGVVTVAGAEVTRRPGSIHPSPLVVHVDRAGHAPGRVNDYVAEHRGIEALRADGLVGVELHGHIHLHPDVERWSGAEDRYDEVSWYREFTPETEAALAALVTDGHPLELGQRLLQDHFGEAPTTLVCPGNAWTAGTLRAAVPLGLELVSAERLALRDGDTFLWCAGVPSVYLDKPDASHLVAGLPVVAYFHDYEPALIGPEWVCDQVDRWRAVGARRLLDFRDLAGALALRLDLEPSGTGGWRLNVGRAGGPPLTRPTPVRITVPGEAPTSVELAMSGRRRLLKVQRLGGRLGRVVLPAT